MASSQKTSEEVKVDGAIVIEQRRQSLAKELNDLRTEAVEIADELQQPLIPTQRESRKARLDILWRQIDKTQSSIVRLAENQARVEKASREFDQVTLPKDWFIGLVEPLKRRSPKKIDIDSGWSLILATLTGCLAGVFFYYSGIAPAFLSGMIAWGTFVIMWVTLFMVLEPRNDSGPLPHSVFRGVIPKLALQRYDTLKTAGLFDSIIVASPHKDAFVQMGVRRDPVMIGTVGSGVRFGWNGCATVESAGLTDSCVFLFEIARWDTAADLGNLGKA